MSDETDDLLHQLGALEREYDESFPHEWEQAVRGDASVDEVAAKRRAAGDPPEEVEALAKQLGPMEDAEREAWVDRLAEALGSSGEDAGDAEAAGGEVESEVVSLDERRRSRAPWVTAAVGLLAAAALVLWLRPRTGDGPADPGVSSLPAFTLTVRNETVHEVRSGDPDPGDIAIYLPRTRVRWVVRPERSVSASVGLRVLAEAKGSDDRRLLDPGATVTERGVLEVQGAFESVLGLPPGRWTLRLVVGTPPPSDPSAFDAGGPWTVVEPIYEIEVRPDE